jgi:hypothetical protein
VGGVCAWAQPNAYTGYGIHPADGGEVKVLSERKCGQQRFVAEDHLLKCE